MFHEWVSSGPNIVLLCPQGGQAAGALRLKTVGFEQFYPITPVCPKILSFTMCSVIWESLGSTVLEVSHL